MITINSHKLIPTIFPDNTSQVWQLPDSIKNADYLDVIWHFEEEREIIDLLSLRSLKNSHHFNKREPWSTMNLHIPYLPYARQDKDIENNNTFNLHIFAKLINLLKCELITSIDVHNLDLTKKLIQNFGSVNVNHIHFKLIEKLKPDHIIYPDSGAALRYRINHLSQLCFYKTRNPLNGTITDHYLSFEDQKFIKDKDTILILDDICDGGATFISMTRKLKTYAKDLKIYLFVTHGLFSRGREVLENEGIIIYTTNSLLKNKDGIEVLRETESTFK